jgi:hypothetical protein
MSNVAVGVDGVTSTSPTQTAIEGVSERTQSAPCVNANVNPFLEEFTLVVVAGPIRIVPTPSKLTVAAAPGLVFNDSGELRGSTDTSL